MVTTPVLRALEQLDDRLLPNTLMQLLGLSAISPFPVFLDTPELTLRAPLQTTQIQRLLVGTQATPSSALEPTSSFAATLPTPSRFTVYASIMPDVQQPAQPATPPADLFGLAEAFPEDAAASALAGAPASVGVAAAASVRVAKAVVLGNPNQPGAVYNANLTTTNLPGIAVFINTVTGIQNGFNKGGGGWVYTQASGFNPSNWVLTQGSFQMLDNSGTPGPEYQFNLTYSTNTADAEVLRAEDYPTSGFSGTADQTILIDTKISFKLYLMWKYPSGVYYPLANVTWAVNFYADTWVQNFGVTVVEAPNGVTANAFTRDNTPPQLQAMAYPIFNQSNTWK